MLDHYEEDPQEVQADTIVSGTRMPGEAVQVDRDYLEWTERVAAMLADEDQRPEDPDEDPELDPFWTDLDLAV